MFSVGPRVGPKGHVPIGLGWGSGDPKGLGDLLSLGHLETWDLGLGDRWFWDSGTRVAGKAPEDS